MQRASPDEAAASAPDQQELSAYERQRDENIERNKAVLAALGLLDGTKHFVPAATRAKRKQALPAVPTRASGRVAGLEAENDGILDEAANGTITLASGERVEPTKAAETVEVVEVAALEQSTTAPGALAFSSSEKLMLTHISGAGAAPPRSQRSQRHARPESAGARWAAGSRDPD